MSHPGELLREARRRRGVTQRSLARRAGTTQAAISRIESGRESPSFERLTQLLLALGERPELTTAPLEPDIDRSELVRGRRLSHEQRLVESASWNLLATQLELAGIAARRSTP
jgi:transcriptional regulator with XRE-family HTH domain